MKFYVFACVDDLLDHASATMLAQLFTTRNLSPGDQFLTEAQYDMKKSETGDLRQSY